MRIKHSKYKNTGLVFELLVKQIAADTLQSKDSKAVNILKKYFTGSSPLVKEFRLYEFILKNKGTAKNKAEQIIATVLEESKKLDKTKIRTIKYNLIRDLKEHYNLEDFFSIKVAHYKPLAALYCLLESQSTLDNIDPDFVFNNKVTLVEHLTGNSIITHSENSLLSEYASFDKDLKLLTYRVLLEKFNKKYSNLQPEQKNLLKEYIVSLNSTTKLRSIINEELVTIKKQLKSLEPIVKEEVTRIKLKEVVKGIKPLNNKSKVTDEDVVKILQYHELVKELQDLK